MICDGLDYDTWTCRNGNKYVLIDCESKNEKIEVKNKTVRIDMKAFRNCKLKEVVFPDSLYEISTRAFCNCDNLQKIVFGESILKIGTDAFHNCPAINEVVFPETAEIRDFYQNDAIDRLMEFLDCLITIDIEEELIIAKKLANFLCTKTPVMTFKLAVGNRSIRLPKHMTGLGKWSFQYGPFNIRDWFGYDEDDFFDFLTIMHYAEMTDYQVGAALEMYILDKNEEAKEYLIKNASYIISLFAKYGLSNALMEYLNLGILDKDKMNDILNDFIANQNLELSAYILEQLKTTKHVNNFTL